jgi:hypothetical protein
VNHEVVALDRRFLEWKEDSKVDPETALSFGLFKSAMSWAELTKRRRVVILAEGGSGKTTEIKRQFELRKRDGLNSWYCSVEAVGLRGFKGSIPEDALNQFNAWKSTTQPAWFYLDSIDEAKLHKIALETAMSNFRDDIGDANSRAHVVFAGRYSDWEAYRDLHLLETYLAIPAERSPQLAAPTLDEVLYGSKDSKPESSQEAGLVALMLGLDHERIGILARSYGITNVNDFVAELERNNLWHFARRPVDLKTLVLHWLHQGKLSPLYQMIGGAISLREKEHDPQRARQTELSPERITHAAQRLGAALAFSRTSEFAVPDGQEPPKMGGGLLKAEAVLEDFNGQEYSEFINTALFDPASFGRLRLHNDNLGALRTFLAAQWLSRLEQTNISRRQVYDFLFADSYGLLVIKPSMREVAAWMSVTSNPIAEEVVRREPWILVTAGDPQSLPLPLKSLVLRQICCLKHQRFEFLPILDADALRRFSTPDLEPVVREQWFQYQKDPEVRELLLRLIWLGQLRGCSDFVSLVAFSVDAPAFEWELAGRALLSIGSVGEKRRYADILLGGAGYRSLAVLWHMLDELFPAIVKTGELIKVLSTVDVASNDGGLGFQWYGAKYLQRIADSDQLTNVAEALLKVLANKQLDLGGAERLQEACFPALLEAAKRLVALSDPSEAPAAALNVLLYVGEADVNRGRTREELQDLRSEIDKSSARRRLSFWHADRQSAVLPNGSTGATHSYQLRFKGWSQRLQMEDVDWLLEDALSRQVARERLLAIRTACEIWRDAGSSRELEKRIRETAAQDAELAQDCNISMAPIVERQENLAWRLEMEQHQRQAEAKKAEDRQEWMKFLDELKGSPQLLRHDSDDPSQVAENRLYAIYTLLDRRHNRSDRYSFSDLSPVEGILGPELFKSFGKALRAFWRTWTPTLTSKRPVTERGLVSRFDLMALTSIAVDVERESTQTWAGTLNSRLAAAAVGFATIELNGFPEWLKLLAKDWPNCVAEILLEEVRSETADQSVTYHKTLAALSQSDSLVKAAVALPLMDFLLAPAGQHVPTGALDLGLRISAAHLPLSEKPTRQAALLERFQSETDVNRAASYLIGLFSLGCGEATEVLMNRLKLAKPQERVQLVQRILPHLFGSRRYVESGAPVSLTVDRLKLLVVAAYRLLRDRSRPNGQVFSPDVEDHAGWARTAVFNQLVDTPGRHSFDALIELSMMKKFQIAPARLRALARERAAQDAEDEPWRDTDALEIERHAERPPHSSRSLMGLTLRRLVDLAHDLQHDDNQPGRVLRNLKGEEAVQNFITRELKAKRNNAYRVVREDEVADKKKPDIRILATAGDGMVSVEVKIAEAWTLSQLKDALSNQLVGQYLRARGAKYGILLLVHQERPSRLWGREANLQLTFAQVVSHLSELASKIEREATDDLGLAVVAFDVSGFPRTKMSVRKRKGKIFLRKAKPKGVSRKSSSGGSTKR